MKYLLTLTREDGVQADVDIDIAELDLDSPEGARELADAIVRALADIANDV